MKKELNNPVKCCNLRCYFMKIDHIALWTTDLEATKSFYEKYFQAKAGEKYHNAKKGFSSYFLSFDGFVRLELMYRADISDLRKSLGEEIMGFTHLAISVGTKAKVDAMTELLRKDGYKVVGEARTTGDGYYESVVLDIEGNRLEITV
jgi:lactoylglutathione lyase